VKHPVLFEYEFESLKEVSEYGRKSFPAVNVWYLELHA
jgi:hypothetical protein